MELKNFLPDAGASECRCGDPFEVNVGLSGIRSRSLKELVPGILQASRQRMAGIRAYCFRVLRAAQLVIWPEVVNVTDDPDTR